LQIERRRESSSVMFDVKAGGGNQSVSTKRVNIQARSYDVLLQSEA
jgi:hypothetical protein